MNLQVLIRFNTLTYHNIGEKMLKRRFYITVLTFLIVGIFFQGTYAHEDDFNGSHTNLVSGFAHTLLYSNCPLHFSFTASATCQVDAFDPPHPQEYISGYYEISASAAVQGEDHRLAPPDEEKEEFKRDIFDWVANDAVSNSKITLWAKAEGTGEAKTYRTVSINGEIRNVYLFHQHTEAVGDEPANVWVDAYNDRKHD